MDEDEKIKYLAVLGYSLDKYGNIIDKNGNYVEKVGLGSGYVYSYETPESYKVLKKEEEERKLQEEQALSSQESEEQEYETEGDNTVFSEDNNTKEELQESYYVIKPDPTFERSKKDVVFNKSIDKEANKRLEEFFNNAYTPLVILLIFFGIRMLFRFLFPYLLRYLGRKAEEILKQKFQQMTNPNNNKESSPIEKPSLKKEKQKVGEYIDYEEIE